MAPFVRFITALAGLMFVAAAGAADPYDDGVTAARKGDYETALQIFRDLSNRNDPKGHSGLGVMYLQGLGVDQDYTQAARWFRMGAEQGFSAAQENLAYLYWNGLGIEQDLGEAVRWLRAAAEQGRSRSQALLGISYLEGKGVVQDFALAFKWAQLSAAQNDPSGQHLLGTLYRFGAGTRRNYSLAIDNYKKAATRGFAPAQSELGDSYLWGDGVPFDIKAAIHWFRKAAAQNEVFALHVLKNIDLSDAEMSVLTANTVGWKSQGPPRHEIEHEDHAACIEELKDWARSASVGGYFQFLAIEVRSRYLLGILKGPDLHDHPESIWECDGRILRLWA